MATVCTVSFTVCHVKESNLSWYTVPPMLPGLSNEVTSRAVFIMETLDVTSHCLSN